jgi:superfamily II DNA or RNA helicase
MVVDSVLTLDTNELTDREWRRLFSTLSYVGDDGDLYEPWQIYPHKKIVRVPRGAWAVMPDSVTYRDRRVAPEGRALDFIATLDSEGFSGQEDAVRAMLEHEQGIIVAQPGWGKTNVALAFAAKVKTPTLVLVHTEDILQQWIDRIEATMPETKVGVIRGRKREVGDVTVATVQTFRRVVRLRNGIENSFGAVILDEAHHAPADTFDEILNSLPAKYRFGFTATDKRADGRHPYMTTVLGPVIYRSRFKSKVPVKVVPVKSGFRYHWRGSWDWRNLLNALKADEGRNRKIARLADKCVSKGNSTLILSREIEHLQNIQALMKQDSYILAAKLLTKDERRDILTKFRAGEIKCVLATQLADEALDVPILSRVFLTFPGKHDGRIIQQVGRALREHPEKTDAVIYDVVDDLVGVLRRQWMMRKSAYKAMKIRVQLRKVRRV